MLLESGNLIPVKDEAVEIPWTKRKAEIINFLHRGPVTFRTYVYDTNVGDIAPLTTYFNPNVWSDTDLNNKFGQRVSLQDAAEAEKNVFRFFSRSEEEDDDDCNGASLQPKLIIFPEIPKLNNKEATRCRNPSQSRSNKLISKPQSLGICSDSQTNRILTSKRPSLSLLPNPPDSTPSNDEKRRSCSQSNPIAPPKRRKLSLNDEDRMTKCNLLRISSNDIIPPRSASTSDIKSPLLNLDPIWDSAFANKTDELQQPKNEDDGNCNKDGGNNHLTHSLRKIAKRNELEN